MGQKRINQLDARSTFDETCKIPVDDASQTWYATGQKLLDYLLGIGKFDFAGTLRNIGLAVSNGSSALTIALKTNAGNNASATDPIFVAFRNATAATGTYVLRSVTAALSTVISNGSTAGFTSGTTEFLYVYLIDNAGTVELAWSTTRLWDENSLQTTTAEGGAGAADDRHTLYSTTARSNVAIRLVGRIKFTLATAGTWNENGDEVSLVSNRTLSFRSEVCVHTSNGHGTSTGTTVRRFTTAETNVGTAITYADVAASGSTFTINEPGLYAISYMDLFSTANRGFGITLNSSQLTTNINSITQADRLVAGSTAQSNNGNGTVSVVVRLKPGDVIRPQTDAGADNGTTTLTKFRIIKIAD